MRTKRLLAGLAVAVVTVTGASVTAAANAAVTETSPVTDVPLAEFLRQSLDELAFQEVIDLAPPTAAASAAALPIRQQPQIDATVLELDAGGRITGSATVLMSPQYPHGIVVPVDGNFHTSDVRWREWDDAGWYANQAQGTVDIVPGRENASIDYMSPYPASVLKLMVAFGVLRLVDQGVVALDDTYAYQPATISSLCGPASTDTIRDYLDASLTESSNAASCALIKMLWDNNAVDPLNRQFQDLGLETLRLLGTNPVNGGRWSNSLTMSSLDTAKLLAIINSGRGTLWTTPAGVPVTRDVLSDASRRFFYTKLSQQGWNWMLSTTNYCGRDYPAAGIPQLTHRRWIAADGTVTVAGNSFGEDVRPCNREAEVTFAHKPGWTNNTGADAGIVKSLPGKAQRHYIISVFSNLGDQYQDPNRPATPAGTVPVEYTEKFAQLGALIDDYQKRH